MATTHHQLFMRLSVFHVYMRFQKVAFLVAENAVLVWKEGLNGEIMMRFQIYPAY